MSIVHVKTAGDGDTFIKSEDIYMVTLKEGTKLGGSLRDRPVARKLTIWVHGHGRALEVEPEGIDDAAAQLTELGWLNDDLK